MKVEKVMQAYKKRTPPREKKAAVVSGVLKNTVPIITPWIMKELETGH